MPAPACAHVLLETVALVPYEGAQFFGAGHGQVGGDSDGHQQQELLAPVAVAGYANGDDERLAQGTGLGEYSCTLDEGARIRLRLDVCFSLVNRPVRRTCMPGGVGRAG